MKSALANYHIYNQYIIRVAKRDELRQYLIDNNIGNEIYYPLPFHMQECFSGLGYKVGDFPYAEETAKTSIALPIYPELGKEQIEYVVNKIKAFFEKSFSSPDLQSGCAIIPAGCNGCCPWCKPGR